MVLWMRVVAVSFNLRSIRLLLSFESLNCVATSSQAWSPANAMRSGAWPRARKLSSRARSGAADSRVRGSCRIFVSERVALQRLPEIVGRAGEHGDVAAEPGSEHLGRLAADDHHVGRTLREQAHADHAGNLVERTFHRHRIDDL